MNIALWIAQFFLAFSLFYSGGTKAFVPMDVLAAQWPSIGALAPPMVRLLGVIDMLGAIGLIVPAILRIKPALTVIAAWGVVLLMVCAIVFHIQHKETAQVGVNLLFGSIALFIAWGRSKRSAITDRMKQRPSER